MTTSIETHGEIAPDPHPRGHELELVLAILATLPGLWVRFTEPHLAHPVEAVLFGLTIVGSAFLLSWAAEVAQLDISAGLAIAVLAFIAVLPEYAVDFALALKSGNAFEQFGRTCQSAADTAAGVEPACSLALANMTGANRLLIGLGWSMVVFVAWLGFRRRGTRMTGIVLERTHSVELAYLSLATAYSLTLPLKSSITLLDTLILVAIFAAYTVRISRAPAEEVHLVGPARWIGTFTTGRRRTAVLALFAFAAFAIFMSAEHFAEALVATGQEFDVSEFLLLQWVAPFASEAPELLVAGLYAWRLNTSAGLGMLVSSKVNQWTLLVGTLPVAFALASGTVNGLPIASVQREELFLTAAQSVFAVAILMNLEMSTKETMTIFSLFWAQFIVGALVPENWHAAERIAVGVVYLVLGAWVLLRQGSSTGRLLRSGFRTPYAELHQEIP